MPTLGVELGPTKEEIEAARRRYERERAKPAKSWAAIKAAYAAARG